MNEHLAHAEDGTAIESVDFDYSAIDKNVFQVEPEDDLKELTPREMEAGLKVLRVLLQWIWQSGMKNPDGVKIRAIICCWIFLKELRSVSETNMAIGYGMKKQSLGRWVEDFKRHFKNIRIPQLR